MKGQAASYREECLTKLFVRYIRMSENGIQITKGLRASQSSQPLIFVMLILLTAVMGLFYSENLSSVKPLSNDKRSHKPTPDAISDNPMLITMPSSQERLKVFSNGSITKPKKILETKKYQSERSLLGKEVPYILNTITPFDMDKLSLAQKRKISFIKFMLPLIFDVNEVIKKERRRISLLHNLFSKGQKLTSEDKAWLSNMADRYGLETIDFNRLLKRVDTVPPSLAIAQAAEESGWGTSRFVREGNALFGQRAYSSQSKGIVPKERPVGTKFRVRAFNNLRDSVIAYVHNLNTHFAYSDFRKTRATLRADFGHVNGYDLAGSLIRYSERGKDYIKSIRSIMRYNALQIFDAA